MHVCIDKNYILYFNLFYTFQAFKKKSFQNNLTYTILNQFDFCSFYLTRLKIYLNIFKFRAK